MSKTGWHSALLKNIHQDHHRRDYGQPLGQDSPARSDERTIRVVGGENVLKQQKQLIEQLELLGYTGHVQGGGSERRKEPPFKMLQKKGRGSAEEQRDNLPIIYRRGS